MIEVNSLASATCVVRGRLIIGGSRQHVVYVQFRRREYAHIMDSALATLDGRDLETTKVTESSKACDDCSETSRDLDKPFLLPVEEVFSISGRGAVAAGRCERGIAIKGAEVEIIGLGSSLKAVITGIEMFRKELDRGEAGDNFGCLFKSLNRDQIKRGQVIVAPGSMKSVKKFLSRVYVLTKDEGGRQTPFMSGYRPRILIQTAEVASSLTFPDGTPDSDSRMIMPGDNVELVIELLEDVAAEPGTRFKMLEGGKTVGTGTVIKVLEYATL